VRSRYSCLVLTGIAALVAVPFIDQLVKAVLRRRLGGGTVSLAALGQLRIVESRIWMQRASAISTSALWAVWLSAAVALSIVSVMFPSLGIAAGLLLGGSLSHALETTIRGAVADYVCLRFWPSFNLADVAVSAGALGLIIGAWRLLMPAGG
jgi:signal peptidase II